jgi:hypothetical protein
VCCFQVELARTPSSFSLSEIAPLPQHDSLMAPRYWHDLLMAPLPQHDSLMAPLPQHDSLMAPLPQHDLLMAPLPQHDTLMAPLPQHDSLMALWPQHDLLMAPLPQHDTLMTDRDDDEQAACAMAAFAAATGMHKRTMPVREQQPCPGRGRGLRVPNRCFLSHHTRLSPPSTTGVDCLSHSFSVCRRCHPRRRHPPRRRRRCRRPSDLRGRRR